VTKQSTDMANTAHAGPRQNEPSHPSVRFSDMSLGGLHQGADMSDRGAPLTMLYVFAAVCGLFAAVYGALELQPSPAMAFLLGWGPAIGVAWWLAADTRQHRMLNVHDVGLFFYLTWPLTLPWYAWRSRGRAG
jgi:hypothetical protein